MDKRLLSQENIFNNLKILVFEHNENSKENYRSRCIYQSKRY